MKIVQKKESKSNVNYLYLDLNYKEKKSPVLELAFGEFSNLIVLGIPDGYEGRKLQIESRGYHNCEVLGFLDQVDKVVGAMTLNSMKAENWPIKQFKNPLLIKCSFHGKIILPGDNLGNVRMFFK